MTPEFEQMIKRIDELQQQVADLTNDRNELINNLAFINFKNSLLKQENDILKKINDEGHDETRRLINLIDCWIATTNNPETISKLDAITGQLEDICSTFDTGKIFKGILRNPTREKITDSNEEK